MNKYFKIFNLSLILSLKNTKALIGLSIFLVTCLIIFAHIWKIAAAKIGAIDLNPSQLLWYIALNEWILVASPEIQDGMEQDLRSGRLAYLLPRPISYLGSVFAEGLGTLCANLLVLGAVTFSFTWFRTGEIPFDLSTFPTVIVLGLLAGCVSMIFQMLVGLSAFWIQNVEPFEWIWGKLLLTLGGLMLPLAVYPLWLQNIAYLTPFPAILGQRSALALEFSVSSVFLVAGSLILWGLIGLGSLALLYRRGLRIVNIEGG